jgi:prepilin-type N-terminal cleavage/methylation domain-containing protein
VQARAYFMYGGCIMTNINKKAFTLIELLVVVLIIGILAAIALPQYKLATDKARVKEALIKLKAMGESQMIYYLTTGEYATDKNQLDITVEDSKYYRYSIRTDFPNRPNLMSAAGGLNIKLPSIQFEPQTNTWMCCHNLEHNKKLCLALGCAKLDNVTNTWCSFTP